MNNIVELLSRRARESPRRPAVVWRGRTLSFAELEADSERLAAGLSSRGVKRGARAALMLPPSPDFFAAAFALFRLGAVPVLIDPGMGLSSLGRCLAESAPEFFLGSPKAQLARLLGGWARASVRVSFCSSRWPGAVSFSSLRAAPNAAAPAVDCAPDETAAILFTSGSTGAPKGVIYTHPIFLAQVALLREMLGCEPGERTLPTFPLFGLFDVALGMTAVIPEMDSTRPGSVDPRRIVGPIQEHKAAQLFGSPALLDAVGRFAAREGVRLPSLRRVISAGAPVPAKVIERFAGLLPPGSQVFTPYGATEALPVALIGSDEILSSTAARSRQGAGTCVGRPVRGMEVAVIRVSDEPIARWSEELRVPDGEIGEFAARGPVVTRGYDARPEADQNAKIAAADGTLWHRMGDLGWRDSEGRLWFCGRKSQRVATPRGTLYTIPCEAVFNEHPKVRRTALVGLGPEALRVPALCVELEKGHKPSEALKQELLALGAAREHTRAIRTVLFHPGFPVDIRHNAKIFREKLTVWAQRECLGL